MYTDEHIVDFKKYCENCIYRDLNENDEPCDECLDNPVNTNSRRPVNFEPTEEFIKKEKIQKEKDRLISNKTKK